MNRADAIGHFMQWGRGEPQIGDERRMGKYLFTVKASKPADDGKWRSLAERRDGSWLVMDEIDG